MADQRLRLTDELLLQVLRTRSAEPQPELLDEIVRAAEAMPQRRGWFGFGPMRPSPRILLIAAIALLLAAAGAAIGARLLLPEPELLLQADGDILAADEGGLVSVDPETGERKTIKFCDGCRLPTWSADGSTLAFVRADDVIVRDMTSGREREVARCGTRCSGLSLSGDGSLVAYANGRSAIVHDLDAATETTFATAGVSDVALSPDGDELIVVFESGSLHRVRLDGGQPLELEIRHRQSGPVYASWSQDGQRIAYVVDVPFPMTDTVQVPWEYQLWVMDADGGDRRKIWTRPGCCMRGYGGPSWSPDGTQIAVVVSTYLHVVGLDGSHVREVAGFLRERAAWGPMP